MIPLCHAFVPYIYYIIKDLDYSFVGVQKEDIEALNLGVTPIQFKQEPKISEGDEIFILQHPKGRPKEFSHDKIMAVKPPFVYYKADTETGSSGAPVLWKLNLVAVHQKGSEDLNYNKGVLCSEILSHLNTGKCKEIKF
jgi:V8-like Glu-specific endopeptidase